MQEASCHSFQEAGFIWFEVLHILNKLAYSAEPDHLDHLDHLTSRTALTHCLLLTTASGGAPLAGIPFRLLPIESELSTFSGSVASTTPEWSPTKTPCCPDMVMFDYTSLLSKGPGSRVLCLAFIQTRHPTGNEAS
ncbi:hypothetical protein AcW1_008818 [Taiwanofungus camphoratus]|nr:hypothetical protein AcV5_006847 [Antrodia cinnamomea]KAI0935201.1 hypothetical protein AcV7_003699 [Antrodia cinnamomea]KAI0949119.1 hypothetical protein AcW1_008818 [Antrodia cinnamomea]